MYDCAFPALYTFQYAPRGHILTSGREREFFLRGALTKRGQQNRYMYKLRGQREGGNFVKEREGVPF